MKNLFYALIALATFSFAHGASAAVNEPLYDCALTFHAHGGGIQVIIGYYKLQGEGTLRCVDAAGNTEDIPVTVKLGGKPLAARIAIAPYMALQGAATGIGVSGSPRALLGRYNVVGASGALGVGASSELSLHGNHNSLTFNADLAVTEGLGFAVGLSAMEISAR